MNTLEYSNLYREKWGLEDYAIFFINFNFDSET